MAKDPETAPPTPSDPEALVALSAPPYPHYVVTADRTYYPVQNGTIQVHPRHVDELLVRRAGDSHRRL